MPQFQEMDVRDLQVQPKPHMTEHEFNMASGVVPKDPSAATGEELDARDRQEAQALKGFNDDTANRARTNGYDVGASASPSPTEGAPSPYGDMYNP